MIATFYSDTRELILYADREELWELEQRLRDPAGSTVVLEPQGDAEESAVEMRTLRIDPDGVGAVVSVDGDETTITGSGTDLATLGERIADLDDEEWDRPGAHAHFEPDDGRPVRFLLSRGSCELTVAGPVRDDFKPA
jgi:hypothetical protein